MKPRVMSLVLFTSMVGLLIAPNQVSFLDSIISLAAIALGAGGGRHIEYVVRVRS